MAIVPSLAKEQLSKLAFVDLAESHAQLGFQASHPIRGAVPDLTDNPGVTRYRAFTPG